MTSVCEVKVEQDKGQSFVKCIFHCDNIRTQARRAEHYHVVIARDLAFQGN